MAVNKCTNLNSYPIPKIEDLYTNLSEGRKLAKLNLRSAFLHKDSKTFLTINTRYQFNRLSFGFKSAPGIYQCCMDNLFTRETHVVSYQDDILITGSSHAEYLDNLEY